MAWKSGSFAHRDPSGKFTEKVDSAAAKHKDAMKSVVERARALSRDRKETLDKIADPQLRKSAAR